MTPGLKATAEKIAEEVLLEEKLVTPYRADDARCNYAASDRPDVQYAAKEICRWMSAPTDLGLAALKRLVRFSFGTEAPSVSVPLAKGRNARVLFGH